MHIQLLQKIDSIENHYHLGSLMSEMTLDEVPVGYSGLLSGIAGVETLAERLRELGFVPGQKVELQHRLVFGEPFVVRVNGASIALRRSEAQCLRVQSGELLSSNSG